MTGYRNMNYMYIFMVFWTIKIEAMSSTSTDECDKPVSIKEGYARMEYNGGFTSSARHKRSKEILCPGLCEPKNIPSCYCDSLCHAYNDCCLEYKSNASSPSLVIQSVVSCELDSHLRYPLMKPYGVVMVKSCLRKYSASSLENRCSNSTSDTDPLQMIPVTDQNGLSFANIYCALCNDIYDVSPWDLASMLTTTETLSSAQNLSELLQALGTKNIKPVPEDLLKPRVCVRYESRENLSHFDDRCYKYQEPVLYNNRVFRNHHCIPKNIKSCHPNLNPYKCTNVCIKGRNVSMTDYLFERHPRFNSILIKFGRHLRLEYESHQCTPGELLLGSKVKCVHLDCVDSGDKLCKPFEIYYSHFRLQLQWYLGSRLSESFLSINRCANMILNMLSFSKMIHLSGGCFIQSYKEEECELSVMSTVVSYVGLKPVANAEALQLWLSTVHFSYTEIRGNTKSVIHRAYPGKEDLSDTPDHTTCTKPGVITRVDRTEDKESMVNALARYPLPLPIYKCSHINITVSVEELIDAKGKDYRKYKVMGVNCTNVASVLFVGIWKILMMAHFCTVLKCQ